MRILLMLVPISLVLLGIAVWAFVWAVRKGQFDDLDTPPLDILAGFAARFLASDGVAILPKGRGVEQELTTAAAGWHFTAERFESRTDPEATILRLSEIRRARDA